MLKKLLSVAVLIATCSGAMAQSGQLGANQIWGNPTALGAPSKPSNVGSFLTQGTGVTISGTPKATIGLTNQITAGGPSGSATQTPVLTYNAQGQLTVVSLATIAPPFSAVTGIAAIAQGGTGQITQAAAISALMPTPTRAGDVAFWNGSNWVTLAGNNSGTQILTENSSGVPSWAATGSVSSVTCGAGLSGGTITTTGTCAFNNYVAPTTWTPTDASGGGLTFTSVTAIYTRINSHITAQFRLTFPSTANAATVGIGGFPVASNSSGAIFAAGSCIGGAASNFLLIATMAAGGTSILLVNSAGANPVNSTFSGAVLSCDINYTTN
jgi:hypothetical protein